MSDPADNLADGACGRRTIAIALAGHGSVTMTIAPSRTSRLLKLAPWTRGAWVTIAKTVYYPAHIAHPEQHVSTLAHEYVHVLQWKRYNLLLWLVYLLGIPFPLVLAVGRMMIECEAYAHEVVHFGRSFDACLDAMCSRLYGWLGPRALVRLLLARAVRAHEVR